MKNILITGATGFIGKGLCNKLSGQGMPFVAAVRQHAERGQIEVGDLSGNTNWAKALNGCDAIVHLAARVQNWKPGRYLLLYRGKPEWNS